MFAAHSELNKNPPGSRNDDRNSYSNQSTSTLPTDSRQQSFTEPCTDSVSDKLLLKNETQLPGDKKTRSVSTERMSHGMQAFSLGFDGANSTKMILNANTEYGSGNSDLLLRPLQDVFSESTLLNRSELLVPLDHDGLSALLGRKREFELKELEKLKEQADLGLRLILSSWDGFNQRAGRAKLFSQNNIKPLLLRYNSWPVSIFGINIYIYAILQSKQVCFYFLQFQPKR